MPELLPDDAFEKVFRKNSASFHFRTEAGRRTFLDLFLRDVVTREEFRSVLRIFTELEHDVKSVADSGETFKLSGVADYTVGAEKICISNEEATHD